ncbi:MAG: tetraacyldisaccharide 4'-kinase [Rickettsiales bacterium]|nr:tetraacyldisaccharide 4'-kinase [Rickettsiales bacterium]
MMMEPLHWSSRSMLFGWLLLPVAWVYGLLVRFRLSLVTPTLLSVPVICVGNTTVGGAGKTPTVIQLCKYLQSIGQEPHVISRGYKGNYAGTVRVDPAKHDAIEVGDEPMLIAQHAPCWVARKRTQAANAAIAAGATVIIMDDGLQNPSIVKDMTINVVDGTYGFGNGFVMPAGPCRESVKRSMRKSDAVLIMNDEEHPRIRRYIPEAMPVFAGKVQAQDGLPKDVSWHAFAGIAQPDKFFRTLESMGANIVLKSRFADHYWFKQTDLDRLLRESEEHGAQLITTEKDAMRLPEEFTQYVTVLPVELVVEPEAAWHEQIKRALVR